MEHRSRTVLAVDYALAGAKMHRARPLNKVLGCMKKQRWQLDPKEVTWGGFGMSSGRRKHATKASRATTVTAARLELRHVPTGITVYGEVPPGNYTRGKLTELRCALYDRLFVELESKVGAHLRVPGRAEHAT